MLAVVISKNTAVKANDVTEDVDYEISTLTEAIECSFEEPGDLIFELVDFSYDSDNLTDEGITVYDPVTAERVSGEGTRAYTVHNYSGTLEVKKKILEIDTKIATLSISGEFYYYDDGRVHLYSMTASGTGRLGWSVSADNSQSICNNKCALLILVSYGHSEMVYEHCYQCNGL